MEVKLWGVRGAIPAPMMPGEYRNRLMAVLEHARSRWQAEPEAQPEALFAELPPYIRGLVGGETPCIEVQAGSQQLVLDMGTGARRLGYSMMQRGAAGDLHILITRTYWDYIQGWPFFIPGYIPTNNVHFYSIHSDCESRFARQQHADHFPVHFQDMASQKTFHILEVGKAQDIGSVRLTVEQLQEKEHACNCYRIEAEGKAFVYVTTLDFTSSDLLSQMKKKKKFFDNADLFLLDAEDGSITNNGHKKLLPAFETAIQAAVEHKFKRLVFSHHRPGFIDKSIFELLEAARAFYKKKSKTSETEILLAQQDAVFTL